MCLNRTAVSNGVFRTQAWGQAWLDTWGNDSRIQLIDLGDRKNPREMLYRVREKIKKILPVSSLYMVGVGCNVISTPRAEYNDIGQSVFTQSEAENFVHAVKKISWKQFCLSDVVASSENVRQLEELANGQHWLVHEVCREPSYYVKSDSFSKYLAQLSPSTRLAYFNRRKRLQSIGDVELIQYPIHKAEEFFELLNQFHLLRWGNVCYSADSKTFLRNFIERLNAENGIPIMEAMAVKGEIVSLLFDVILDGCRYNFQSGYTEKKFAKVALGAVHMGYAIESAINSGLLYDFMAGEGKHTNYKARIATDYETIKSINIERGHIKYLRKLNNFLTR